MPLLQIREELIDEVKFSFANKKKKGTKADFVLSVKLAMASSVAF